MRMIVANTEGGGVNVRADPDANSARVGGLAEGTVVDAADRAWRHIRTNSGTVWTEGWVAAEFLAEEQLAEPPEPPPAPPSPEWHFTAEQVASVLGAPLANVQQHLPTIYAALEEFGIGDRATTIAALATIGVETGSFLPVREAFWMTEEWRKANFRYWPYYGRGFIQLTWVWNFQHYGDLLGEDLVNDPDRAMDPTVAARVLALYFLEHNIVWLASLPDWAGVRRSINGGLNGWDEFAQSVDAFEALP